MRQWRAGSTGWRWQVAQAARAFETCCGSAGGKQGGRTAGCKLEHWVEVVPCMAWRRRSMAPKGAGHIGSSVAGGNRKSDSSKLAKVQILHFRETGQAKLGGLGESC